MDKEIFTKRNKIVKCMTFELKPIGKTRETLRKKGVLESDARLKEYAAEAKVVGDAFYRDFLEAFGNEQCASSKYNWLELRELFDDRKSSGEAYNTAKGHMIEVLAKDATKTLQQYIDEYFMYTKEGKGTCKASSAEFVDKILRTYAEREENKGFDSARMTEVLDALKGTATTMFKKHFVNWEKTVSGTSAGSVAFRLLENFEIFCANANIYAELKTIFPEEMAKFELENNAAKIFMKFDNFSNYFSQSNINTYNEAISGRYSSDGKLICRGINAIINELRQKNDNVKLRYLTKMKKQILSVDTALFKIESIQTNVELCEMLANAMDIEQRNNNALKTLLNKSETYDTERVYICGGRLSQLSYELFKDWSVLENAILERARQDALDAKRKATGKLVVKLTQKEENAIKASIVKDDYSLTFIDAIIADNGGAQDVFIWAKTRLTDILLEVHKSRAILANDAIWNTDKKPSDISIVNIRTYLEAANELNRFLKTFMTRNLELNKDYEFYGPAEKAVDELDKLNKIYNMCRNYLTKKIDDKADRTQLCFGKAAHFEQTWQNKDRKNNTFGNVDAALLEKDGRFYYIVPSTGEGKRSIKLVISDVPYEGENYAYLTTIKAIKLSMAVPKATFKAPSAMANYKAGVEEPFEVPVGNGTMVVSKAMFDAYNAATYRDSKQELVKLIDFYKEFLSLHPSYVGYDFSFLRPSDEYKNLSEFCMEVDAVTYKVQKRYLDAELVNKAVEAGEMYLFMITNTDMYKEEDCCKDVTSLYFRKAMATMNAECPQILINNAPAIYHRPALIEARDVHPVGSILLNKRTRDGKYIPDDVYMNIYHYLNKQENNLSAEAKKYMGDVSYKTSDRPHIKDAHYSREMFTITLSYTINADVAKISSAYDLNRKIRDCLRTEEINIISLVRGYNNLLYYVITDKKSNILDKGSLNIAGDTDFYEKLKILGKERKADQKNWKYEKTVATLKDTYLGMITSKIVKLALDNNAVICIENISDKEKNRYSAFDANVYKKFEEKLISKLACYVDRTIADTEPGGLLNPLQLATKECNGTQNGILFYISPAYIKNVCPKTGFVNLLDTHGIKSVMAKRQFLNRLNNIHYNVKEDMFEFSFTYKQMGCTLSKEEQKEYAGMEKEWTICTRFERLRKNKYKRYEEISGTSLLKQLLDDTNIEYKSGSRIDVSTLSTEGIKLLFDIFVLYANGFYPKTEENDDCVYFSPTCAWNSLGKFSFDELTALNLATKGRLTLEILENLNEQDKKAKRFLEKIEWLDYLLQR